MNKNKLKTRWIKFGINLLFFVVVGYFIVALVSENVALFNRYHQKVVVTDSMEPTINVGSLVIVDETISVETLSEGDIIAFHTTINNQEVVVIHYIYSMTIEDGEYFIETIAENADDPDDWLLREGDYIGQYRFHISHIGRVLLFTQSWIGRIIIVVNIIGLYVIYKLLLKPSKKAR